PLLFMFTKNIPGCDDCTESAITIVDSPGTESVINTAGTLVTVAIIVAVFWALFRRWRQATPALRRVIVPVYLAGAGALGLLLVQNLVSEASTAAADAIAPVFFICFTAVPFAFLLGILRSRLARA